jgi:hypothetical protein
MTAVVGILNKQAVALAADSAVTISGTNGRKIFNQANKVFALSKYHPVGIMLYNSASFMSTPWETLIKMYRKELGDKSFPVLKDYQEDFLAYIRKNKFFTDKITENLYLKNSMKSIILNIIQKILKSNKELGATEEGRIQLLKLIDQRLDLILEELIAKKDYCEEFKDLTFTNFDSSTSEMFNEIIDQQFTKNNITLGVELTEKTKIVLYELLRSKTMLSHTGLIFAGFGESEIYPSLIPLNISLAFEGRLKYYIDSDMSATISNSESGAICPFAQTDVIDTILSGIEPKLDKTYLENFEQFLDKYNQEIINILGETNSELIARIKSVDLKALALEYTKKNDEIKQSNYINPLMNAVSTLSKEDLAEMAESLIYLTYLKRRITFAEESVGGPVDVAIISKGDGFIWMKRKHYFKPELNRHFSDNYFI